uniref:uncharacterized protein LOC101300852 isoform X1 n=1 Tax=Fragaria vesca subsp. vesca TaxID=101020 RepID=UPI0005C8C64C|nr:PREDICTED: uncharacterized protein LOC101300852 isoform X1 [Fragaria vesca subsp. vesca]
MKDPRRILQRKGKAQPYQHNSLCPAVIMPNLRDNPTQPGNLDPIFLETDGRKRLRILSPNVALQSASPPQESHGTATKHLEDNYVADESHECGNFEDDCPVFQAAKSRLMTARVYCPFCHLLNDGRCSHFDHRCLGHPSLKFCRMCYKYGEHWADQCPNVVGKGPLPPLMYCRTCYSREHQTSQCPNAVL